MMHVFDRRNRRREERRSRTVAAARRQQMDSMLGSVPQVDGAHVISPNRDDTHRDTGGRPLAAVLLLLAASVSLVVTLASGGPFFGDGPEPVTLLVGASLTLLLGSEGLRLVRRCSGKARLTALGLSIVVFSSFLLGSISQVTVDDRPQWRYSTSAKASELAYAIRTDLYLLQENQSLLAYPPEQARSMLAYYDAAAAQADQLAVKWNPATAPRELPLPGFVSVLELLNSAADLQRQALAGYAAYLREPDARLAEAVQQSSVAAEQSYLLAAQELARVIAPIGITLTPEGSQ